MSYVVNTASEQKEMLEAIGVPHLENLFDQVPNSLRLKRDLAVPGPFSEQQLTRHMGRLAKANQSTDDLVCFLGEGPTIISFPLRWMRYPCAASFTRPTPRTKRKPAREVCRLLRVSNANLPTYGHGCC